MRRRGFAKGMVAGSVIGMAAAIYLAPVMNETARSKGFRRIRRDSQNTIVKIVDFISDFRDMM